MCVCVYTREKAIELAKRREKNGLRECFVGRPSDPLSLSTEVLETSRAQFLSVGVSALFAFGAGERRLGFALALVCSVRLLILISRVASLL